MVPALDLNVHDIAVVTEFVHRVTQCARRDLPGCHTPQSMNILDVIECADAERSHRIKQQFANAIGVGRPVHTLLRHPRRIGALINARFRKAVDALPCPPIHHDDLTGRQHPFDSILGVRPLPPTRRSASASQFGCGLRSAIAEHRAHIPNRSAVHAPFGCLRDGCPTPECEVGVRLNRQQAGCVRPVLERVARPPESPLHRRPADRTKPGVRHELVGPCEH